MRPLLHLVIVLLAAAASPPYTFASRLSQLPRDAAKDAWVRQVLTTLGLSNDIPVVRDEALSRGQLCAFAQIEAGVQWIVVDPKCVVTLPSFSRAGKMSAAQCWGGGVMLHEVGHHLGAHTATHGKPDLTEDFETEKWTGWAFRHVLGASLDEARCYASQGQERATATHISRADRLRAVEMGWRQSSVSLTAAPPTAVGALPPSEPIPRLESLAAAARRQLQELKRK